MNNSAGEFSTDYYEDFSIGLDTILTKRGDRAPDCNHCLFQFLIGTILTPGDDGVRALAPGFNSS